ncbi:MAG: aminoacetone oxidase family FAD-binding enzyme [Chloroflexi bacterium]|nr:aminoacetone oxidase family FAD-binding enzyme [Chloroflexota bacterium]
MQIGIIGAGTSGLCTAIKSKQLGLDVQVFDANSTPGRKLSATGSGRCNISNQHAGAQQYFTDDQNALQRCFEKIPLVQVLTFLESCGIPTTASEDGWIYPHSYSAANVVDILMDNLKDTKLRTNTLITKIIKNKDGFILHSADPSQQYHCEKLILACGSPANPQLGARAVLYDPIAGLGHTILPVHPALSPIETDPTPFHKLQGVRLDAGVELLYQNKLVVQNIGNIIITQWGLNGPGVMDISHWIDPDKIDSYQLKIDFAARFGQEIEKALSSANNAERSLQALLKAYLPAKVVDFLLQHARLEKHLHCGDIHQPQKEALLYAIHNQVLAVRGVRGFKFAQASTGGVPLGEICPETMQSRRCPGLFFAGELVNVLGPCGGFNLHWAFLSGLIAANGLIKK